MGGASTPAAKSGTPSASQPTAPSGRHSEVASAGPSDEATAWLSPKTPWYSPWAAGWASEKLNSNPAAADHNSPAVCSPTAATVSATAPAGAGPPARPMARNPIAKAAPARRSPTAADKGFGMDRDTRTWQATTPAVLSMSSGATSHDGADVRSVTHSGMPTVSSE